MIGRKTKKMAAVEDRFNEPLEEMLPPMLTERGLSATAEEHRRQQGDPGLLAAQARHQRAARGAVPGRDHRGKEGELAPQPQANTEAGPAWTGLRVFVSPGTLRGQGGHIARRTACLASRSLSLSIIARRLSYCLRPLARPSSILARWRFRYSLNATMVSRFSSTSLASFAISSLCSSSFPGLLRVVVDAAAG